MADDADDGDDHLDDAQAGKNTALRTRANASELARQQRNDKPGTQTLLARARRGRDMTEGATDESKQVGGFVKRYPQAAKSRSERWYDNKDSNDG